MQRTTENLCKQLRSSSKIEIVQALRALDQSIREQNAHEFLEHFPNCLTFTIKHIRSSQIIESWLNVILSLTKYLNQKVIEFFPKSCGGCFLCTIFLIAHKFPNLESKVWMLLKTILGDQKGIIVSRQAVSKWVKLVQQNYPKYLSHQSGVGICLELKDGYVKDFIEGLGELIQDEEFVKESQTGHEKIRLIIEKAKLNPDQARTFFESNSTSS